MGSHKHSTQIERLEVVETGRRRRWSDDEKLRIVMESLQAPRAIPIDSETPRHIALIADDVAALVQLRANRS
jgi:transposase-like protein